MTDPYDRTAISDTAAGPNTDSDEAYCSACNQSFGLDRDVCPNDGARLIKLKATQDVLVGRVFDQRYELRSSLGHGGMGTVYRAHQISVDREVAIKVIHPKLASDRVAVKRFLREARLASRLNQPNVVNVYDFGQTDDGILYLVMEMLRGHTLARELEAMRPLPLRRILHIALQLCDALEVAHAQEIVHRDLKPSNIIVLDDPPGRDLIKVLDFGLAKSLASDTSSLITASSALLGTPLYMPPEQIAGEPSDHRADLYAFGCILYHLLDGRPPFLRDNVNAVLAAHLHDTPPALPATVPAPLASLVATMMAKDPAHRPGSAAAIRTALQSLEEHAPDISDTIPVASNRPDTSPMALAMTHSGAPSRQRPRALVFGGAALALAALAGGAYLAVHHGNSSSAPPPAIDAPHANAVPPPLVDAALPAIDAAAPADATAPPVDAHAAHPVPPPRTHPHIDAGAAPSIDAGAAPHVAPPVDAGMPSIDFTH
ncbi:MAG: protein kinase [Deltaproteobacteria bacterium]|nr:protein kinase [Deltaproteobacteria bacterium]